MTEFEESPQIAADDLASTLKVLEELREDLDSDGMVDERDIINVAHGIVDGNREGLITVDGQDVIRMDDDDDSPRLTHAPEAGNMLAGMRPSKDVPDGKFEAKIPNGANGFRVEVTAYTEATADDWEGVFSYFAKNRYYPLPETVGVGGTVEFQAVESGGDESEMW